MATLHVIVVDPGKEIWVKGVQMWFKSNLNVKWFVIKDLIRFPSDLIERFNMLDTELAQLNWYGDYVVILRESGNALLSPIHYTFTAVEELEEILT